jgi:hypothetical protein
VLHFVDLEKYIKDDAAAKFYFAPMFEEESISAPNKTPKARSGTPKSKSKRNSKESY